MLISSTVTIQMVGGVAAYAIDNSALVSINFTTVAYLRPNVSGGLLQNIGGGLKMNPQANVIHSAEVSINPP